jgi:hypothetical protein
MLFKIFNIGIFAFNIAIHFTIFIPKVFNVWKYSQSSLIFHSSISLCM